MAIPGLGNFGSDMADWPRHYSGGDDASDASRRRKHCHHCGRRLSDSATGRQACNACDTLICGRQPPPDGR